MVIHEKEDKTFFEWFRSLKAGAKRVVIVLIVVLMCGSVSGVYIGHNAWVAHKERKENEIMSVKHLPRNGASVAFGDSTMSLADGVRIEDAGCMQEENNWVDRLPDVINMSCPGADVTRTIKIIKESTALRENPKKVLVSIGTNTMRKLGKDVELEKYVQYVVNHIRNISPESEIVFVGYLKVFSDVECLNDAEKKVAKYTDDLHIRSDEALKKVAGENNIEFVPMDDLTYDMCDSENTFVRIPNTTKGTNWHTTSKGHEAIAQRLAERFPEDFSPLDTMK